MTASYYPLIMDTGTVILSSWLLLWASGTFRQQLIKDFAIIRKINIQNIRGVAMKGPRNNNHLTVEELLSINTSVPSNNCRYRSKSGIAELEVPRNNNYLTVGGAVGHQYISSVQQLPTVST
ncbi:hypothetical protein GPALN_005980 [Globodera pallida]|nr:hypothetical protein GPALN_005980 [Globodera pallida]